MPLRWFVSITTVNKIIQQVSVRVKEEVMDQSSKAGTQTAGEEAAMPIESLVQALTDQFAQATLVPNNEG